MKTQHSLSFVAALILASTAHAQIQTPPNSTDAQRDSQVKADNTMPATQAANADMHGADKTDKLEAKMVGTKVQMSTGENLGEVKEVLFDTKGNASYAVIAHGSVMGMGAKRTAVPWSTVKPAMQHDKLILDRSQLAQAPVLPKGATPDASIGSWSRDADMYWRTKVSAGSTTPAPVSNGNTKPSEASPAPAKR